jgi:hypothetical protein
MASSAIILSTFDRIARRGREMPSLGTLVTTSLVCMAAYGACMGTFRVLDADRWKLVLFGAMKSPLLLIATTLIVLPGFFVLNTAFGLRDDFRIALRGVLASQAALALALLSLGPVTMLAYASNIEHHQAILFNALMFTIATAIGQIVMLRWYRELIARDGRHRFMLLAWLVLYAFVGMQTGWMLRPFIGGLERAPTFLREDPFTNAYVAIWDLISR